MILYSTYHVTPICFYICTNMYYINMNIKNDAYIYIYMAHTPGTL